MRIHEGVKFTNRDKRTLLDKLLLATDRLNPIDHYFLVADAYYGSGKLIKQLVKNDNQLITRAKINLSRFTKHQIHSENEKWDDPDSMGERSNFAICSKANCR
ncbi:hypothetical protein AB833_02570 [Chromatiales bacterium (ex Bugula neritina AB1)]|nr:hypothetical protein AB833_02570 [Chromatiales bacterium (ex Bugula neritina AB1)]